MSRRSEKVEVMIPFVLGVGTVHLLAILFFGTIGPHSRSIVRTDLIANPY